MSLKSPPIGAPPDVDETSSCCGATSTDTCSSATAISKTGISASAPKGVVGSHPGLLALARVLGRHAARAEMRRTRRGAVPLMVLTDTLLVVVALIVGALIWSIGAEFR